METCNGKENATLYANVFNACSFGVLASTANSREITSIQSIIGMVGRVIRKRF